MTSLLTLGDELASQSIEYARRHFHASMFVKLGLVLCGATVAAVAQCVEIARANHEISGWTIAGLAGAALVFIGSAFVAMTETDNSMTIDVARRAIDEARLRERRVERSDIVRSNLQKEIGRGLELYNSIDVMRGAIEQSLAARETTIQTTIQTCLSSARNSLLVAFDFSIEDTWTICVYEAQRVKESDKVDLRCIASARSIECNLAEARVWHEGVGVAGVSYSMGNDIIIPDLNAPELGTVFNLKTNSRPYDENRYRSMVAIPIRIGSRKVPWGVAVVTTDKPKHFKNESADGVPTSEPVRAIAAMAALAVKAMEDRHLPAGTDAPTVEPACLQRIPKQESTQADGGSIITGNA